MKAMVPRIIFSDEMSFLKVIVRCPDLPLDNDLFKDFRVLS